MNPRPSRVLTLIAVLCCAALLTTCATLSYYMPRPDSIDDTLLVVSVDRLESPLVEYWVILEEGVTIRVFPMYSFAFMQGLPPGEHRAVRVVSGKPGGSFNLQSVDIDVRFTTVAGEITVFPIKFSVEWTKKRSRTALVTITQRCTFTSLVEADLPGIQSQFESYSNSRQWASFPFAALSPAVVPVSTVMVWKESHLEEPAF